MVSRCNSLAPPAKRLLDALQLSLFNTSALHLLAHTGSRNLTMNRPAALAVVALFYGTALLHAQEAAPKSTSTGVFTAEQAKRGESAYNSNCATCHGSELRSANREVPSLAERSFKFSWVGKTIAEKFEVARDT